MRPDLQAFRFFGGFQGSLPLPATSDRRLDPENLSWSAPRRALLTDSSPPGPHMRLRSPCHLVSLFRTRHSNCNWLETLGDYQANSQCVGNCLRLFVAGTLMYPAP